MRGAWWPVLTAATILMSAGSTHAADKVECSRLDLEFPPADKADWAECYRFHQTSATSGEGAEGASADIEILVADIGTHVVHIISVVAGRNNYFDKVPASKKLNSFDELEKIEDMETEP